MVASGAIPERDFRAKTGWENKPRLDNLRLAGYSVMGRYWTGPVAEEAVETELQNAD